MATTTLSSQIRDDEMLKVAYTRVEKLDAPLLIIGLGGTGSDAVQTIKATFANRFVLPKAADGTPIPVPRRTGYLVLDTDHRSQGELDNSEFVNIYVNGIDLLVKDENHNSLSASEKSWIHRDLHYVSASEDGIGTNRSAGRLVLERSYTKAYNAILKALTRLVTTQAGGAGIQGAAQLVVVTGIGGGTGSGTFLDMGQILRHMMHTEPALNGISYNLSCFIVMPDLTIAHLIEEGVSAMIPIVKENSYAALKELDFWMDYERHHTRYVMHYAGMGGDVPVVWGKPYDHVTLMSGTNVNGTVFNDSYKLIQRTIAENLLHYMAHEKPSVTAAGTTNYSFLSYENNLDKQQAACLKNEKLLPLNHVYRAVGAYSKRIPKGEILYTEGGLLFKTFIPMRDSHGKLVPNNGLLTDGKAQQRFSFVAKKNFQQLYYEFAANIPFPKMYEDLSARNKQLVENLRKLNPAPHLTYDKWRENSVAAPALKFAESYKNEVWSQFRLLCRNIMSDPAFGPFSLKQYLEDKGKSPRVAFAKYAESANSMVNNLHRSVSEAAQICVNSYSSFLNPPILGGGKAVQSYLNALRTLLDTIRQYELAKQYAYVMQLTVRYIDAYIADALTPLCNTILELESDFKSPSRVDSLGSNLFPVSSLDQPIQSTFSAANKQGAVSRSFLGKLCDSSFDATKNADVGTCGLTFTFRQEGRLKALLLLRQEMDACFPQINNQSLDSIMMLQCADDNPAQQVANQIAFTEDLKKSVQGSARPLFSLNKKSSGISNDVAQCLYFSVPEDSPVFFNHLIQNCPDSSLTPKESSLTDHIYCNMTWDGLPLYSYSLIDDIKQAYDSAINAHKGALALHIVWDGDKGSDFQHNWCKLPSPVPFYLFSATTSSQNERDAYDNARALVSRGLASGLLTIDSTPDKPIQLPSYTFHIFRKLGTPMHNEIILQLLNEVLSLKDKVTGAPLTPDRMLSKLDELLNSAEKTVIQATRSPTMMRIKLGLDPVTTPIDPFDPTVSGNPVTLREASVNFHTLTIEYTTHILLQNPALLYEIEYQIESFEAIAAAICAIRDEATAWEPRIAYAETFAKLFTYGFVKFSMMGDPTYTDAMGGTSELIQKAIFKKDLENCKPVVRAVGAAADLTSEHDIRKMLEFRLDNAEKTWNDDALHHKLTAKQISEQISRLEELGEKASSERKLYLQTKQTDIHADASLLDKQIALVSGVEAYTSNRLETLRNIKIDKPAEPVDFWVCPNCAKTGLTGMFCPGCGTKRPEPQQTSTWVCLTCGKTDLTGMFCPDCGTKRP